MGKLLPVLFCKFVYLKNNFTQLCQPQITFQKANDIVKNFIEQDEASIELLRQHLKDHAVTYQFLYVNLHPKIYLRNNHFGIHNESIFEYTCGDWYIQKSKYRQSPRKDQTDGGNNNNNNSNKGVEAAAGKNPDVYEQRSDVNEFEQRSAEELKFESSQQMTKPKKINVTTKAQMDARLARKQEERRQKKLALEEKLSNNTNEMNKLKDFAKKRKTSL